MKNKSTRIAVLRKLQSLRDYSLNYLRQKSEEIGLPEKSLFFQTAKARIMEAYDSYYDGINCRDGSRLKDFLKDTSLIVQGFLIVACEDYFAT